jgi:hypothetical protein
MARFHLRLALLTMLACGQSSLAACIDYTEAPRHIGSNQCVTGKVMGVHQTGSGTWFLNFCGDYRKCPFTAVVFAGNLRDVGDVRELNGKNIELHGTIQQYRGQTEIILKELRQLRGDAAKIPPIPKGFDVARRGNYSAGSISNPKSSRRKSTRRNDRRDPPDEPEPAQE